MRGNELKESLKVGKAVFGTCLTDYLDPEVVFPLRAAGLDFFFVDTEHSPASHSQIQGLCRSARVAELVPMARVIVNQPYLITRMLDVGAMGIVVPHVDSPEAARAAAHCAKFPPLGKRGFGLRAINTDLQTLSVSEAMASANRDTVLILQIESQEGLAKVDEIASVLEIDVLMIGPLDLSISLGIPEQFENSLFLDAIDKVVKACRRAGIAAGMASTDMDLLRESAKRGVQFLVYSADVFVLLEGYKRAVQTLRDPI